MPELVPGSLFRFCFLWHALHGSWKGFPGSQARQNWTTARTNRCCHGAVEYSGGGSPSMGWVEITYGICFRTGGLLTQAWASVGRFELSYTVRLQGCPCGAVTATRLPDPDGLHMPTGKAIRVAIFVHHSRPAEGRNLESSSSPRWERISSASQKRASQLLDHDTENSQTAHSQDSFLPPAAARPIRTAPT